MQPFRDKVAIVTGGGMGLGRALCEQLGTNGALVVVADVDGEAAQRVASELLGRGLRARAATVDVADAQAVTLLVQKTASELGRLDYLFNNAAIVIGGEARDLSIEQWDRVLAVNLRGVIYGALAAYPIMVRQAEGHIVNISSLSGLIPQPGNAPYSTAKWGLVGFSLALRCEAADLGVKVSVVCPGDMKTDIYRNLTVMKLPRDDIERLSRRTHFLMPQWSAERAAREILKGVARNRAVVVFPGVVRGIWRLYRSLPSFVLWVSVRRMRMLRKFRLES